MEAILHTELMVAVAESCGGVEAVVESCNEPEVEAVSYKVSCNRLLVEEESCNG